MNARPDNKTGSPSKAEKGKSGRMARDMALYSTLLVILPSCVLAGYWIGALLDEYFGTGSLLAMLFLLGGALVGFYQMYHIITRISSKNRKQ